MSVALKRPADEGEAHATRRQVPRLQSQVGVVPHAPGGCRNRPRTPRQSDCSTATNALKSIFLCDKDEGTIWNTWSCGFARHWDCRNSIKRRKCPGKHYALTREFFDLRRGLAGDEEIP